MNQNSIYAFGPYRFDPFKLVLTRDGELVHAPPQALRVLAVLISRADSLATKDEIFKAVWPDAFVSDGDLTQHIYMLRQIFGDSAWRSQYIATVSRRGYRFIATVSVEPRAAEIAA